MSYLEKAKDLYAQMEQGKSMEAFEQYYHEDVKVTEIPTNEVRNGKAAQREAIKGWFSMVKERHGGGTGRIMSNEEEATTSVESWMDITFQDGNRMKMTEVAVQEWKDGQIIDEKFYYNAPGQ